MQFIHDTIYIIAGISASYCRVDETTNMTSSMCTSVVWLACENPKHANEKEVIGFNLL